MADITMTELAAALPEGDSVRSWWEGSGGLPGDTTPVEFLIRTLHGAFLAAQAKNENLAEGEKISSYTSPAFTAVQSSADGILSYRATYALTGVAAANLDVVVTALQ
ncbi:hypothetical protein IQ249_24745 [Lusitaniella coriacea LEGE 07157]|uniref:Uncharacterized protein n=1 Tax=Lusitaniella coriacea LEGE 07157 TaxID=945747 RepID=A0A8J7E6A9_9CYAN|nr:hypothetical protein [Lusitaniella coriacea]MBE9119069.1 hypothetical protein [Lusitaniella coriacea LEGE 07157]